MQVDELLKPFPIKEFHPFPRALMGPGAHEMIGPEALKLGFRKTLVMTSGLRGTDIVHKIVESMKYHGLEVVVPDERHHETVNRIVYDELVHGKVLDSSRRTVVSLIDELWDAGAQGVILGCTELELLVKQADAEIPVFPCTTLHVEAALDRALA